MSQPYPQPISEEVVNDVWRARCQYERDRYNSFQHRKDQENSFYQRLGSIQYNAAQAFFRGKVTSGTWF